MIKKILFLVTCLVATYTFGQTPASGSWVTAPPATADSGTSFNYEATFDAGDNGAGTDYTVGGTFSIEFGTWDGSDMSSWVYISGNGLGNNGIHSGTVSGSINIDGATPASTTLAVGTTYVYRILMQNSNNNWSSILTSDITITDPPVPADAIAWTTPSQTYNADTSIDVSITYTSDMNIEVGALEVSIWSVSGGQWSQQWRDSASNQAILPAGENLTTTITIGGFPTEISNTGVLMTNEELFAADPNPAPAGFTSYYYELRFTVKNQAWADLAWTPNTPIDVNFVPTIPGANFIHVDPAATASVEDASLRHIKIYPNPTSAKIFISDLKDIETITIHNLLGQEVKSFKAQKSIDISDLSNGIYFLQSNNGLKRKIIKN